MKNPKAALSSLVISFCFLFAHAAYSDSSDETLKKEWNAVKKEYPNFTFMFIENHALLRSLLQQTESQRLQELVGSFTDRSCALELLPKCPVVDRCEVIKKECDDIREESITNPDGLDAANVNAYGECMFRYRQCKSEIYLCCP